MSSITFQRTPKQQIEQLRSGLQQLERSLPKGNNRAASDRRTTVRILLRQVDDLEANLKHIEATGELKTF